HWAQLDIVCCYDRIAAVLIYYDIAIGITLVVTDPQHREAISHKCIRLSKVLAVISSSIELLHYVVGVGVVSGQAKGEFLASDQISCDRKFEDIVGNTPRV